MSCKNTNNQISKIFIAEGHVKDITDVKDFVEVDMSKWGEPKIAERTFNVSLDSKPTKEQQKFLDYLEDDNNKRIINTETGNIYHFVTGELVGNINDEDKLTIKE